MCETTFVQSLPQSVRLLQSQLKAERLASAQLQLEVKDAMKMSEDCRAHHHAINLVLMHLSLTQLRSTQLLRLFGGPTLSVFWERGYPDLPACGLRRGSRSGPVRPIFINTCSRPSRGDKPHGADNRKLHQARPCQAGSRGGGEIKAGYLTRCP